MSDPDPFDFVDGDKTIIRPRPGGKQPSIPPREPASPPDIREGDLRAAQSGTSDIFITGSFSILSLAPKIRNIGVYHDINGLYQKLVKEINEFEKRVLSQGVSEADARTAKLFLCALLDEAVLNTPWGSRSNWKQSNLSSHFFQTLSMGNIFFDETDKLKRQPSQKLELLKLSYVCLSLGFQGKYRTKENGHHEIEEEREELHRLIQQAEGNPDPNLSVRWQGQSVENPLIRYVPLWVVSAVACLFLLVSFSGFLFAISNASESAYSDIVAIGERPSDPIPARKVSEPEQISEPSPVIRSDPEQRRDETGRFRKLLSWEISKNLAEVLEGPIIRIPNTFLSGKDEIKKELHPIFIKIADEVKNDKSRIEIFGHTDNQKIRFSIRFPDNYRLSEARAERAAEIMRQAQPALAGRLSFKGMGYSEPIVPNNTKANRAANRRIDIHIR